MAYREPSLEKTSIKWPKTDFQIWVCRIIWLHPKKSRELLWTVSYWLEVSDPRVREKKSEPDARQFNIPPSLKSAAGVTFSLADCACQVLAEVLVGLPLVGENTFGQSQGIPLTADAQFWGDDEDPFQVFFSQRVRTNPSSHSSAPAACSYCTKTPYNQMQALNCKK